MEEAKKIVLNFLIQYGFQAAGAVFILACGYILAKYLSSILERWFTERGMEPPLKLLICRVARILVFGLTAVLALDKFGVQVTPLVAGIGVAGVGIGLATQGVLSNLMAGLTLIFTKPFRVGEFVELLGVEGQVTTIELFTTTLAHADRSRVVIPNRKIIGEIVHNYGHLRQLNLGVGIAYNSDLKLAMRTVQKVLEGNTRVLKDPAPVVGVNALADSAIEIAIKPWVNVADYGPAGAELNQALVEAFREAHIEIPFPQREVRLLNQAT
jgi:small conductance mechanosensitive channel